ncbi:hypothetical protein [Nakamurella sp.]|uniref:hypothetical protein n=1 Tax=Nakamurella sp. TaxID=1869182 RepID=UPI003B3A4EC8
MAEAGAVAEDDEAGTFGVYGPGATAPSRAVTSAPPGRRPGGVLGRAQGELAGTDGVRLGPGLAAAAAPAAAAAAPAVVPPARPGVGPLDDGAVDDGVDVVLEDPAASVSDPLADRSWPGAPKAPVRAPAALAGPDFFRPRRSSSDFLGGASPIDRPGPEAPADGTEGAGPGCGDGTGEAAERGADEVDAALAPDAGPRPESPGAAVSDDGPVTGVADAAERAEYAELAE